MVDDVLWPEFRAELKRSPRMKEEMRQRKSHVDKKLYKKAWAARKVTAVKSELQKIEKLTIDDTLEGEMFTLKRLAVELGDDLPAAINWARSCLKIGPPEFEMNVLYILLFDLIRTQPSFGGVRIKPLSPKII